MACARASVGARAASVSKSSADASARPRFPEPRESTCSNTVSAASPSRRGLARVRRARDGTRVLEVEKAVPRRQAAKSRYEVFGPSTSGSSSASPSSSSPSADSPSASPRARRHHGGTHTACAAVAERRVLVNRPRASPHRVVKGNARSDGHRLERHRLGTRDRRRIRRHIDHDPRGPAGLQEVGVSPPLCRLFPPSEIPDPSVFVSRILPGSGSPPSRTRRYFLSHAPSSSPVPCFSHKTSRLGASRAAIEEDRSDRDPVFGGGAGSPSPPARLASLRIPGGNAGRRRASAAATC